MLTSNFQRAKSLGANLRPVAICASPPFWYRGDSESRLAPRRAMLKMPREAYDIQFDVILERLDPASLFAELGDNAVLLCWEAPGVWCHRRRVAEWFENHLGIVVPEYGFERDECAPYSQLPTKAPRKTIRLPREQPATPTLF